MALGVQGEGETIIVLSGDDGDIGLLDGTANWPLREMFPDNFRNQWPCFLVTFLPNQVMLGNIPVAGSPSDSTTV